jgi:hypothetical protein
MEDRKEMLSRLALLVTEEGLMRLRSTEDVKDIIFHHFRIRKYELCVYRSRPDPFLVIFPDRHARDAVFPAGRIIDGPIELHVSNWDLDAIGDRVVILTDDVCLSDILNSIGGNISR